VAGRETRDDRIVYLEEGQPLIFGKKKDKGIRINGTRTEIVDLAQHPELHKDLVIHRESDPVPTYAYLLTQMEYPEMPVPLGIFRSIERPTYDSMMQDQVQASIQKHGEGKLKDLLYTSDTWTVTESKVKT
jgi:2-oxoglutarate ferredoxin oxidoreductase subunit beta